MTRRFAHARQYARKILNLRYRGRRYTDPICGRSFRAFARGPRRRPQAYCPACGSTERHRVLWLYLERRIGLDRLGRVLHIAPEPGIAERLARCPGVTYLTADVVPGRAMVAADLTSLPFDDASFDLAICNHVLEHIPDDLAAMRELRRVLVPGGLLAAQAPVDARRAVTFEDWSVTDPDERERVFFQKDHVRIYGRDFADRLRRAGFSRVDATKYQRELPDDEVERFRLRQLPSNIPARDIEGDVVYTAQR
jgi:SAM-dependent methyltransferase